MSKKNEAAENLPAVIEDRFPILSTEEAQDALEAIKGLVGSGVEHFSVRDLGRIKVPAGGGTAWKLPTADGMKNADEFYGIIVGSAPSRAFWRESGTGSVPPDCSSADLINGNGEPGGRCATCPMDQYKSANDGKSGGKACREMNNILVITEGSSIPLMLSAPPTSLKPYKDYRVSLARGGIGKDGARLRPVAPHGVITKFSLREITGKANPYSEIVFTRGEELTRDQAAMAARYAEAIGGAFATSVQRGDANESPDFGE